MKKAVMALGLLAVMAVTMLGSSAFAHGRKDCRDGWRNNNRASWNRPGPRYRAPVRAGWQKKNDFRRVAYRPGYNRYNPPRRSGWW